MTSGIFALFVMNLYYIGHVRDTNEQKIVKIGQEIRSLFEQNPDLELNSYLTHIAALGYQIYAVDKKLEGTYYGDPFKRKQLDTAQIQLVLQGGIYRGIQDEGRLLKVNNYFENSLRNSVGLPLDVHGNRYAVFIRPNLEQQIGEVRILLSLLLGFTFLFSIVLIVIFSRFIVKPIKKLTDATHKIVGGDYRIEMDVTRTDEIGNLARDFTHMAQSLQQLDQMRQEFVANVSHEIQSPLTSIQGFAQSIRNKRTSPEEEQRYLLIIEEESKRLSSLSKQLLTLATLDKEEHVLKPSSFRLDEQIRQILIVTEFQWVDKQLELDLNLVDMTIIGDQQLLYQVWYNLITNAIKFSNPGDSLHIDMHVDQQDIIVKIRDTGIGIPDNELSHIFERFYKADKNRNRTRSGSGLGLSIVHKVITLHNGHIDVHSELGQGTTFIVRLPQVKNAHEAS
jgi:signal transduction histidine kinase